MLSSLLLVGLMTLPHAKIAPLTSGESAFEIAAPRQLDDYPPPQWNWEVLRIFASETLPGVFSVDNVPTLVVGSAATMGALPFEDDARDALEDEASWLGETGDALGRPYVYWTAAMALGVTSWKVGDSRFKHFAYTVVQSRMLDETVKYAVKYSVGRTGPDESHRSFYSGHTSGAFTYARIIHHYYGTTAGIISYGTAAFIGLSRIEHRKHYLSDVVFGATMGIITGQAAIRGVDGGLGDGTLAFVPIVDAGRRGAMVVWDF